MKFENQTFRDTDVTLDYNEFVDCKIERCTLHFGGGQYQFNNCQISQVRFVLHDAAHRTLTFIKLFHSMPGGPKVIADLLAATPEPAPMKLN